MKNHSQFYFSTSMLSGGRLRHWVLFMESRIDNFWNVGGGRELSEPWTRFTQLTELNEKPPDGYLWSGGRLTKNPGTSTTDLWNVASCLIERKIAMASGNWSSTMLGRWEALKSSIPMTGSLRTPWNTREKWSRLWVQPWPAKFTTFGAGKPVAKTNLILTDQNARASWKPTNLRESALNIFNKKIMRIALFGRGSIRWLITILCTTFFRDPLRSAELTVGFSCLIWCPFCLIWCSCCLIWCSSFLIWCSCCLIWCSSCLIWCPSCLIWCSFWFGAPPDLVHL